MARQVTELARFLGAQGAVIRVALTRVRGSSPREAGTEMFVAPAAVYGTIGGGQLEHRAIEAARAMLRDGVLTTSMAVVSTPSRSMARAASMARCSSWPPPMVP